jgi:regulatory protein
VPRATVVPEAFDERACKRLALDLLARREHSRQELEQKLTARGVALELIASALDGLERSGALAAARFTDSFIRARVAKGQGPLRIRAELAQRGVNEAEAAALLRDTGVDWPAVARAARAKRFGPSPPRDFKERARQARFLQYRGFDGDQVAAALEAAADD